MKITNECIYCGACADQCPVEAIEVDNGAITINDICIECGACTAVCPVEAIQESTSGNELTANALHASGRTRAKDLLAKAIISGGFSAIKYAVGTVAVSAGFIAPQLANNICIQISRASRPVKNRMWAAYERTGSIEAIFDAL